ncbi:MAG: transketolase family protein [Oscillospiraceae bacterium]
MIVSRQNIRKWSMLGQRGTFFGEAMLDIAKSKDNLMVLTADLALLSGLSRFANEYPEKFLNTGIAEQNMIGIAAGLSMEGDCVFATTYASFIAVRSLEHIRQHLSHLKCNVKIVGSSAGTVAAKSGVSHWATEDIAFMRVLPGLQVFSAADALEAYKIAEYAADNDGPMYIRLSGSTSCPIVYKEDYDFTAGKMVQIEKGDKIAVIATGLMVSESLNAAKIFEQQTGIKCSVYNMHTIKPLDYETLDIIFKEYDMIVTVEEHNILGGMGSAVAEYKSTRKSAPPQVFIGFNDTFTNAGSQRYVWEQGGITDKQIAEKIKREWENFR